MAAEPIGYTRKQVCLPAREGDYDRELLAGVQLPYPGFYSTALEDFID